MGDGNGADTDAATDTGRRRSLALLLTGVALTNLALAGASTMATLLAADDVGAAWSGLPGAAGVLGTAAGSVALSAAPTRRRGLLIGYALAGAGALLAVAGWSRLAVLTVAMMLLGVGNSAALLSRYAAADLYPAGRGGSAMGVVVWGGTAGALAAPAMLPLTTDTAPALGLAAHAGPYALAVLTAVGAACAAALLPRITARGVAADDAGSVGRPVTALTAMVTGQVVMVAVMTMTPVHMHQHGHGLGAVSVVLTAHLAGMFALAPLSGRLADRAGGQATVLWGLVTLAASGGFAVAASDGPLLATGMFLLGYGWNLTFTGGSKLLSSVSARMQGRVDGLVWGASAIAGLASGPVMATLGYPGLVAVSGLVVACAGAWALRVPRRDVGGRNYAARGGGSGALSPPPRTGQHDADAQDADPQGQRG
jgi:hypothetical protein